MTIKAQLFITCLAEQFFSPMLKDMVMVLERLGVRTVEQAIEKGDRNAALEAMKLLDESRSNQSMTEVLPVALEALRRNPDKSTPEYLKKLESWGQAAQRAAQSVGASVMSGLDDTVAADEKGVEIAQVLRQVLGLAVHDDRNGLLREAAMGTQRLIQS